MTLTGSEEIRVGTWDMTDLAVASWVEHVPDCAQGPGFKFGPSFSVSGSQLYRCWSGAVVSPTLPKNKNSALVMIEAPVNETLVARSVLSIGNLGQSRVSRAVGGGSDCQLGLGWGDSKNDCVHWAVARAYLQI